MSQHGSSATLAHRIAWRFLSVPLHVKLLGIIALVAMIFGVVMTRYVRRSLVVRMSLAEERAALAHAQSFATRVERLVATDDQLALKDLVRREKLPHTTLRYIVVYDDKREILAHSFARGVPTSLARTLPRNRIAAPQLRRLHSQEEVIFDVLVPILQGRGGVAQLGFGTRAISDSVDAVTRRLWMVLGLCLLGTLLAVIPLTVALTQPLYRLIDATKRLSGGDLEHRAPPAPQDEIGALSQAFNRMAARLQQQHDELDRRKEERKELLHLVIHAQEQERLRIARDLHDQLGGALSALLGELRRRRQTCQSTTAEQSAWNHIEDHLKAAIGDVRHLARSLRPAALDDVGLCATLEQHCTTITEQTEITVDYCCTAGEHPHQLAISPEAELVLFRCAQEALTNVLRHAAAKSVSVVLSPASQTVTVLVEDDGVGFDLARVERQRGHLGLRGMRERLAAVGGQLTIESAPGKGATLRVQVEQGWRSGTRQVTDESSDEVHDDVSGGIGG